MKPGTEVTLGVLRKRGEPLQDVKVTLEPRPKHANTAKRFYAEDLGFSVRDLTFWDNYARHLPADSKGVVVALIRPQSSSQSGGLNNNDLITQLNGQPVTDVGEFEKVYQKDRKDKPKEAVVLVVRREEPRGHRAHRAAAVSEYQPRSRGDAKVGEVKPRKKDGPVGHSRRHATEYGSLSMSFGRFRVFLGDVGALCAFATSLFICLLNTRPWRLDLPKLRRLVSLDEGDPLSRFALGKKLFETAEAGDPATARPPCWRRRRSTCRSPTPKTRRTWRPTTCWARC